MKLQIQVPLYQKTGVQVAPPQEDGGSLHEDGWAAHPEAAS